MIRRVGRGCSQRESCPHTNGFMVACRDKAKKTLPRLGKMAKREFAHPHEMHRYVGQELGVSDWVEVTQDRINQFAEATGDHQWIHADVERAKKDMPGGKTIAHDAINYGCNKVRFTSPVPAGSRVRARAKLIAADPMDKGGVRLTNQVTIEIEGQDRPACVAETMSIVYGVWGVGGAPSA